MRDDDRIRVQHMIDAAEAAQRFMVKRSRSDLDEDQMLLFAVVRAIEIIGEAATKVSAETRAAVPEVPWIDIVGMRHHLIHGYQHINSEIVWKTVNDEMPGLLVRLRQAMRQS
jgi:uncharacterized protein with HEPN domain